MGYLHEGHVSLVKKSKQNCDITVVSLFVNPTQFAPNEDLINYPRDFERDKNLLEENEVDYLFAPTVEQIYPPGFKTFVEVNEITKILEGEFRPTHFKGVTTVVSILFNCVKPDFAYFGQKDAQQVTVLKQMVKDLKFDIEIGVCPIVREADGLAMSSRNVYLQNKEREDALILSKSLNLAREMIQNGERNSEKIISSMKKLLNGIPASNLDYVKIVDAESFTEIDELKTGTEYYILVACRIGKTRLIDNLLIQL